MICQMDYKQITVKELSRRARINRKTFYLHYNCLDDLLYELQCELVQNFINRTQNLKRPQDMDLITREFYLECEKGGRFYEQLLCNDSYYHISHQVTNQIMEKTWNLDKIKNNDLSIQKIIVSFISQSTIEIYRQWITDGKKIPLEEIIELTSKLICTGINSFSEK